PIPHGEPPFGAPNLTVAGGHRPPPVGPPSPRAIPTPAVSESLHRPAVGTHLPSNRGRHRAPFYRTDWSVRILLLDPAGPLCVNRPALEKSLSRGDGSLTRGTVLRAPLPATSAGGRAPAGVSGAPSRSLPRSFPKGRLGPEVKD